MKTCPRCRRRYENPIMLFCGEDGARLEFITGYAPPEAPKNYLQFTSAPVAFNYSFHGGLPHGDNYQTFSCAGKIAADGTWRVSFRDESKKKYYPNWEINAGGEFVGQLIDCLKKTEIAESGQFGGSSQLVVQFSDGTSIFGYLENDSAGDWESFFCEIQRNYANENY